MFDVQPSQPAPIVMGLLATALMGVRSVQHSAAEDVRAKCPVSARNVLFGEDDTDAQDSNEEGI